MTPSRTTRVKKSAKSHWLTWRAANAPVRAGHLGVVLSELMLPFSLTHAGHHLPSLFFFAASSACSIAAHLFFERLFVLAFLPYCVTRLTTPRPFRSSCAALALVIFNVFSAPLTYRSLRLFHLPCLVHFFSSLPRVSLAVPALLLVVQPSDLSHVLSSLLLFSAAGKTGATQARLREGSNINKSLTTLGTRLSNTFNSV